MNTKVVARYVIDHVILRLPEAVQWALFRSLILQLPEKEQKSILEYMRNLLEKQNKNDLGF